MNDNDNSDEKNLEILRQRLRKAVERRFRFTGGQWEAVCEAVIEQLAKETGQPVNELRDQMKMDPSPAPIPEREPDDKQS